MHSTAQYLKQIEAALAAGNATEHTHRPALKTFIESVLKGASSPRSQKPSD